MEHAAGPGTPWPPGPATTRGAVAIVLTWNERVALFKRSRSVAHDGGRWHCITGLLPVDRTPPEQVWLELVEGTGVRLDQVECLVGGPVLELVDDKDISSTWTVHTFVARVRGRRLDLNWEHDAYRWVRPRDLARFDGQVWWLGEVLEALAPHLPARRRKVG